MQIVDVQFPLTLPSDPLRRWVKVALGWILVRCCPARTRQLYRGDVGARLSRIDRLLVAGLVARHERAGTLDRLGPLQRWLWESGQAVDFHAQAEARFERWWREGASIIVRPLQALIDASPGRYSSLCEIGCGSGLVLEDLALRLQDLDHYIGLDLSPAQTARNQQRYADSTALTFEAGDAMEWIPAHPSPGRIYFTNAGVLEYFSEQQLQQLFGALAPQRLPVAFALVEPVALDFDLDREFRSRPFGSERTFSHNYPHLLTQLGWQIEWQSVCVLDGSRHVCLIATRG